MRVIMFVALVLTVGIGAGAWIGTQSLHGDPISSIAPQPKPAPTPQPATIGQTVRLTPGQDGRALIWVNRIALSALDRAYADRDERASAAIIQAYESLWVPGDAWVQIVANDGNATQVQISEGPQAGRRGWAHTLALRP